MKTRWKVVILLLSIGVVSVVYLNFFKDNKVKHEDKSVTKSKDSENLELNLEKSKVSEKITIDDESEKKSHLLSYKDVFKEPKEMQTDVEKVVEQEELKKLDKEVDALISEADALIEKEHLTIPQQEIPKEVKEKIELEVVELEQKLKRLQTE